MNGYDAKEAQLIQDTSLGVPNADLRLRDYREARTPGYRTLGPDNRKSLLPGAFVAVVGIVWIVEAVRHEGHIWPTGEQYALGLGLSLGIAWLVMGMLFDAVVYVGWRRGRRTALFLLVFAATEWLMFALTADRAGLGYASLKWYGLTFAGVLAFGFICLLFKGAFGGIKYLIKHPVRSIVVAGITVLAVRLLMTVFGIALPHK